MKKFALAAIVAAMPLFAQAGDKAICNWYPPEERAPLNTVGSELVKDGLTLKLIKYAHNCNVAIASDNKNGRKVKVFYDAKTGEVVHKIDIGKRGRGHKKRKHRDDHDD